jgi:type I restriction enzyme, S subunit
MMEIIPKSWFSTKIGEICQTTNKVDRRSIQKDKTFFYIDISSIDNTTNKIVSYKSYSWKEAPSRAQQIIYINDILFSTVRTYLKNIAIVDSVILNEQIASSGFTVLRTNLQIALPKLLFYFTLSQIFLQPLNELQTGTSYPAVRDSDVFSQSFPLPPLAEQHRIVAKIEELFSELDKGIETLKTAQQQLKVYRQAVLKYAFEGLEEKQTIQEITLESLTGLVRSNSELVQEKNGIPYIKMNNVDMDGRVNNMNLVFVLATDAERAKYSLKKGDILINTRNSFELVGKTGYVDNIPSNSVFNNNLLRIRVKEGINSKFICYQMISPWFRRQMVAEKKATTNVCALYQRDIFPLKVKMTNRSKQITIVQDIESRLSVCDKIEEGIQQSLQQAEALRQSILKKAFEGKLVPQDPNDEPASVLLARIRSERGNTILSRNKRSKK